MNNKFFKNTALIILLIFGWLIHGTNGASTSRLSLPTRSKNFCPPNKTCEDGSFHFLCKKRTKPCADFVNHKLTWEERTYFIQAHNGIRNKVAKDFGIGNMNLLYWSIDLQKMAKRWLMECKLHQSQCHYIAKEELNVNMNLSFRSRNLFVGWPGRVVRSWYVEIGNKLDDFDNFLKNYKKKPTDYANFTQMIWPMTEFVGCDASSIQHGLMLYVVCFYYPAFKPSVLSDYPESDYDEEVITGVVCTNCNSERHSCSRTFPSLCGSDNVLSGRATSIKICWNISILSFIMIKNLQL